MHALIVDDSAAARKLAEVLLEQALDTLGVERAIETVESGVEALKILARGDVDVLLVDLHMPGLTGLEVLSFYRQSVPENAGIAIVASSQISADDRARAIRGGASGVLEKPVTEADLSAVLAPWAEGLRR